MPTFAFVDPDIRIRELAAVFFRMSDRHDVVIGGKKQVEILGILLEKRRDST